MGCRRRIKVLIEVIISSSKEKFETLAYIHRPGCGGAKICHLDIVSQDLARLFREILGPRRAAFRCTVGRRSIEVDLDSMISDSLMTVQLVSGVKTSPRRGLCILAVKKRLHGLYLAPPEGWIKNC
ncbi:MAG: hypothetical protein F7B20_05795 [Aeropyrum sp.]|nr:hypothetical protein [Aeropyrum sp.]MCE4616613.1 hypothetical protein [Aeropyrum sp.]